MTIERVAKKPQDFKDKILLTPIGRCHINSAFNIFKENYPEIELSEFIKFFGEISPSKIQQAIIHKKKTQDIIVARSVNDYLHGLYIFNGTPDKTLNVTHIIIPGPIARQRILKLFIEHMIGLGLDLKCINIKILYLNENDWRALFLQEAGAQKINPNCLQINL